MKVCCVFCGFQGAGGSSRTIGRTERQNAILPEHKIARSEDAPRCPWSGKEVPFVPELPPFKFVVEIQDVNEEDDWGISGVFESLSFMDACRHIEEQGDLKRLSDRPLLPERTFTTRSSIPVWCRVRYAPALDDRDFRVQLKDAEEAAIRNLSR